MIKIDFHGGTHGHFLEYVSNVYIMQTPPSTTNIFTTSTGSAHQADSNYSDNKLIVCGHFSREEFPNKRIHETDTVIRIITDTDKDDLFFIIYYNLLHKAGDVGITAQLMNAPTHIRHDTMAYRNQFYSKCNERQIYSDFFPQFCNIPNAVFEFPVDAFFSFTNFCKKLNELAFFLNQTFFPDDTLYQLWGMFIERNQGWHAYNKCNTIIENVFANLPYEFSCNIIEEGWINYNLSKICRIYSGPMFDDAQYPTNTQDIYNIIQLHLEGLRYE